MQPPALTALAGLVVLFVCCLPLGLVLLRLGERCLGQRIQLTTPERVVTAFYATGALFFVVTSFPLPLFTESFFVASLAVGSLATLAIWWREEWKPLRTAAAWITSWPGAVLAVGTFGLLCLEVAAAGSFPLGNAYDASFQSLLAKLILTRHMQPWSLEPFASAVSAYPQGAAVWLTVPTLLFQWPVGSAPVLLPLLFLSLSVVGAYCWGERLGGVRTSRGWQVGLLFAGFFGLIASWPRLFVGGSYDFAFALPLFLMSIGWLRPFVASTLPNWKEVGAFGVLLGTVCALSLAVGEALVLLMIAFLLAFRIPRLASEITGWLARLGSILGIGVLFVARSIVALATSSAAAGVPLGSVGNPPFALPPPGTFPSWTYIQGSLDPFVEGRPMVSPIPALSLELELLLAVGIGVFALSRTRTGRPMRTYLPDEVALPIFVLTGLMFAMTSVLLIVSVTTLGTSLLNGITSLYESSYLLFIAYQAVALFPLLMAAEYLRSLRRTSKNPLVLCAPRARSPHPGRSENASARLRTATGIAACTLIIASLGVGAAATVITAPGYLHDHLEMFANVSNGDLAALAWAGSNLPSCSRVLAAPGSAAMFLPLYAEVHLVLPMLPIPHNLSYSIAVYNLTHDTYTNSTRGALLNLDITEVFVTGQTSVSYPPFNSPALTNSSDFASLYASGDATIFAFEPGLADTQCPR